MAPSKAAQDFVPVKEVRNGVIILKDGGYRGILMCSSVNFALKSEEEQQAIVGGFQNFLNTLDFSVEIVVHSRKMDIRPYLALLSERMEAQRTELMRLQLREYIQFIRGFMDSTSIMTKVFYLVIPYTPALGGEVVSSSMAFLKQKKEGATSFGGSHFEDDRVQLEQRMALAAGGLASSGLRAVPLGTEEVIELLYRSFNLNELESPIRL
mgnify:FL=1|jgi:hypothetical protein|tara:strand:+ start:478866 stop:479495 length:630 start_codon:yes stop_codon:yes gene_type:complete